jgi:hypothetical protein
MTCPLCGSNDVAKAIYLGLPVRLCEQDGCLCVHGFWSFIVEWVPVVSEDEHGDAAWAFFTYEGWYPVALVAWLVGAE